MHNCLRAAAIGFLVMGFSPGMKQHYSMDWLEMDDPFTGEREVRTVRLPSRRSVHLCSTVGCQKRTLVHIPKADAEMVYGIMAGADNPAAERAAMASSIAYLEMVTCAKTGTCNDSPNVTMTRVGQLDCVDESTNTTSYMLWMKLHGLIKYHQVLPPASRGFPVAHFFAVIAHKGGRCVVESDFNRTGQRPKITCSR